MEWVKCENGKLWKWKMAAQSGSCSGSALPFNIYWVASCSLSLVLCCRVPVSLKCICYALNISICKTFMQCIHTHTQTHTQTPCWHTFCAVLPVAVPFRHLVRPKVRQTRAHSGQMANGSATFWWTYAFVSTPCISACVSVYVYMCLCACALHFAFPLPFPLEISAATR